MSDKDIKYTRRMRKFDLSGQDKCEATISIRIPTKTKYLCDQLGPEEQKAMIEDIKITIAQHLHEANFDPITYLKS